MAKGFVARKIAEHTARKNGRGRFNPSDDLMAEEWHLEVTPAYTGGRFRHIFGAKRRVLSVRDALVKKGLVEDMPHQDILERIPKGHKAWKVSYTDDRRKTTSMIVVSSLSPSELMQELPHYKIRDAWEIEDTTEPGSLKL